LTGANNNVSGSVWYADFELTSKQITEASGGRLELKPFPAGGVVPAGKEFDGVISAAADFALNASSMWADKFPNGTALSYMIGGLTPVEMLGWIREGGGADLLQELVKNYPIYTVPASGVMGTAELYLHSSKPINKVADLKGLKTRAMGDGGQVLGRMGAAVVQMPGGEVYESMKRGVIDAFELSNPTVDWSYSTQEISPYVYISATRQSCEYGVLYFNKNSWAKLTPELQGLVTNISQLAPPRLMFKLMASDASYLQKMKDYGNKVEFLSKEVEDETLKVAAAYYAEKSAQDPFLAKVIKSQRDFQTAFRNAFSRY